MTIHLTPEQERRIRAVLSRGAYDSVEEVVEAALTAVEQRTVPGFAGTPEELDTLLAVSPARGATPSVARASPALRDTTCAPSDLGAR